MNNFNNLQQNKFKFKIDRMPNLEFRVQGATLPGISLGSIESPTPFTKIPLPGNISYEDFFLHFTVGENMQDYREILKWIYEIGQPERFGQQKPNYKDNFSTGSLMILDSASNPNFNITFIDMFPVSISSLNFDTQMTNPTYITATATFKFNRFKIEEIT